MRWLWPTTMSTIEVEFEKWLVAHPEFKYLSCIGTLSDAFRSAKQSLADSCTCTTFGKSGLGSSRPLVLAA
jgi:hypothetical protein